MEKKRVMIILVLLLQTASFAEEKEKVDHIQMGISYFKSGFYKWTPKHRQSEAEQAYAKAIQEFKQAIAANPDDASAYRNLARVYSVQKKPKKAAAAYLDALSLDPWDVDTYVLAALALIESQQYSKAIQTLQTAKGYTDDKVILQKIDDYIMKIGTYRNNKEVSDAK